ncbi:hypothetical protein PTTG_08501 [Puccinia triticina 1-1 BBBD Race 1]|uniref:FK506-binding protein n=2 Tax=Puccinia triticina TaxID=208348 RepID=A0A0C4F5U7_PUCT1|nr:uncharacterized protein PtA15_12A467 [Puccinia triticina]OAV96690.1 hypothetical protein PTTG_08501 [Puccinia triticina 1-1 BBBD Race 1]WAQ90477.1 hypothetical protein PtA15_12A467 [Puccinia triticina]
MSTLFSAVVKPDKPLLYLCDESTLITNIAVCPIATNKKAANANTIAPFVTVLKLQYEGPVIEGENDDEDDKENVASAKSTPAKLDKKQAKKGQEPNASDDAADADDDDDDDSDFADIDIEAKEVVVGSFTPNVLQIKTELYLAPHDQYRFLISGSQEYEIHLLGRYMPDSPDEPPSDFDSDEDSEDELDDMYLNEISTDEEDGDGPRIEELEDDDEPASKQTKAVKSITAAPAKNGAKSNKPTEEKRPNKRPLEDTATDADVSMADSTADTTMDGQPKLSKAQRKKLKKAQQTEAAGAKETSGEAKAADPKKSPAPKEAAKPATPAPVTLPSGLKIIDTKVGQGADAKAGQSVSMRYIGKLNNGKVFDSNTKGKPFNFKLGRGEVIKGWDEGVKGMKLGGERKLIVPANLAYGKSGAPPDIPPNSVLTFEVKLLAIK